MRWTIRFAKGGQFSILATRFVLNPNSKDQNLRKTLPVICSPSRSRADYIPVNRINLEHQFKECKGLSTMLSEKEFDLVSRSIDRAIRARSLRTVRDLKSTFSYLQHHKTRLSSSVGRLFLYKRFCILESTVTSTSLGSILFSSLSYSLHSVDISTCARSVLHIIDVLRREITNS